MLQFQAGILRVKLQHLSDWNQKRREAASRYKELLSAVDELRLPLEPAWAKSIFHLYVVAAADIQPRLQKLVGDPEDRIASNLCLAALAGRLRHLGDGIQPHSSPSNVET